MWLSLLTQHNRAKLDCKGHTFLGPKRACGIYNANWPHRNENSARAGCHFVPITPIVEHQQQMFLEVTPRCTWVHSTSSSAPSIQAFIRQIWQTDTNWHIFSARLESVPSTIFGVHCGFKENIQKECNSQLQGQFSLCYCAGISNLGHFLAAEHITTNAISSSGTSIFSRVWKSLFMLIQLFTLINYFILKRIQ